MARDVYTCTSFKDVNTSVFCIDYMGGFLPDVSGSLSGSIPSRVNAHANREVVRVLK